MEIVLVKEKETPGTWRFKENKEDHPMTIYLTKEQVKELGSPESIRVTITAIQRAGLEVQALGILHFLACCSVSFLYQQKFLGKMGRGVYTEFKLGGSVL